MLREYPNSKVLSLSIIPVSFQLPSNIIKSKRISLSSTTNPIASTRTTKVRHPNYNQQKGLITRMYTHPNRHMWWTVPNNLLYTSDGREEPTELTMNYSLRKGMAEVRFGASMQAWPLWVTNPLVITTWTNWGIRQEEGIDELPIIRKTISYRIYFWYEKRDVVNH